MNGEPVHEPGGRFMNRHYSQTGQSIRGALRGRRVVHADPPVEHRVRQGHAWHAVRAARARVHRRRGVRHRGESAWRRAVVVAGCGQWQRRPTSPAGRPGRPVTCLWRMDKVKLFFTLDFVIKVYLFYFIFIVLL